MQHTAVSNFSKEGVGVPVSDRYVGVDIDRHLESIVGHHITRETANQVSRLDISSAWEIRADRPGPRIAIFGGVHGLETCGVDAVSQLLGEFCSGRSALLRGSLVLAVANEQAVSACQRQVEHNMNRLFLRAGGDGLSPYSYEIHRAHELRTHVLDGVDAFLDLHSTSAPSRPFAVVPALGADFAAELGIDRALITPEDWRTGIMAGTSSEYVVERATPERPIPAITIECGQHGDHGSAVNAYMVSQTFLIACGFVRGGYKPADEILCVRPFEILKMERPDFEFARGFANFDKVQEGELIGKDGEREYRAPRECHVVLPTPAVQAKVGTELCMFGEGVWRKVDPKGF